MKDKEVLVKVQNVSKKFSKNLKTSLKYGAIDIVRSTLGLKNKKELRKNEFWAVKNVSFELRRGESIGLIGHNGAGKSTLLKILNGLYAPDKGQITMKGKVGALIELGAGFNPILTGRENIYNNAAILGFTREEVEEKMQSIIDFSEIEEFLDMPVKNYSSGMKVRLGFAVAAHMEPDILIIDEVLAVGDLGFVLKCFRKIDEILPRTAVIFVSHNMPQISRMCNEILLLDHGKIDYQGQDVGKGIELYYKKFSNNEENIVFDTGELKFLGIELKDINGNVKNAFEWNEDLVFEIRFKNKLLQETPFIVMSVFDKEQRGIAVFEQTNEKHKITTDQEFTFRFLHEKNQFSKGKYSLNLTCTVNEGSLPVLRINTISEFFIRHKKEMWEPFLLNSSINYIEK